MHRLHLIILFLFCYLISSAQSRKNILTIKNNLDTKSDSIPWINENVVSGVAYSGKNFSRSDSLHEYGLGYKGAFPVNCRKKNLSITISEQLRTKTTGRKFSMVVSVSYKDSGVFWQSVNVSQRVTKAGVWTNSEDVIDIPATITGNDFILAIYLWNQDRVSYVDIDDLTLKFSEKYFPSFLPSETVVPKNNVQLVRKSEGKVFSVYCQPDSGQIVITAFGDTVVQSISMITETTDEKGQNRKSQTSSVKFISDTISNNARLVRLRSESQSLIDSINLVLGDDGKLAISVETFFKERVNLFRHSLIAGYTLPLIEVFKKNTLLDTSDFSDEYWLKKEGFISGNSQLNVLIYHPEVSSLQLDTKRKLAIFNLDYAADHPLLYFPLMKKSEGKFVDRSYSVNVKGSKLKGELSFTVTKVLPKLPRLLNNPNGFLSALSWTEHADYTNLNTNRAVYLGAETITRPDSSRGGFIGYGIPVTKSIFYDNPDHVDNKEKVDFMPGPVASYKSTENYSNFLKQLEESGVEVCLHTPDHFTTNRKLLEEALDVMRREFAPVTWIDHGYDNSVKSNREDLNCDGTDSTSQYYAADLWKKYGLKYFWNSYYEDTNIYSAYSFNSFFSVPYSGWDNGFPTPDYWHHPTRTGEMIHWKTSGTVDPPDEGLLTYFFSSERLEDMVNNRNTVTIHCYPARVDSTTAFYTIKDGVLTATDGFNNVLAKLTDYRKRNLLWLTSIREMLDYRTSIEKITYDIHADGSVRLHNNGKAPLRGVTFAVNANDVNAGPKQVQWKKAGSDLIFWLDLNPDEYVSLFFQ